MIDVARFMATACLVATVAGCGPDYSPNTYSAAAVQQANKVDKGVVVGVRRIDVSAQGVIGAATGAAAGGVIGAQAPGGALTSTFGALGGGLVGGILGTSVEHVAGDTSAYEYIVRKFGNELVSVTQKDAVALALGQHVLVIAGNQARIVPDYTVNPDPPSAAVTPVSPPQTPASTTGTEPPPVPVTATPLPLPLPQAIPAVPPAAAP